jgi:hypothetical protein
MENVISQVRKVDRYGNFNFEIDEIRALDKVFQTITSYNTDQPILTVDSNTRIHAKTIVIKNKETSAITVVIKDGDTQVYPDIDLGAGETIVLTETQLKGLVFSSSVVVNITGTYANGTQMFFGYLVENNQFE